MKTEKKQKKAAKAAPATDTATPAEPKAAKAPKAKKEKPAPKPKAPSDREVIIRDLLDGKSVAEVAEQFAAAKPKWSAEKAKSYVGGYMSNIRQFAKLFADVGFDKVLALAAK